MATLITPPNPYARVLSEPQQDELRFYRRWRRKALRGRLPDSDTVVDGQMDFSKSEHSGLVALLEDI